LFRNPELVTQHCRNQLSWQRVRAFPKSFTCSKRKKTGACNCKPLFDLFGLKNLLGGLKLFEFAFLTREFSFHVGNAALLLLD
jgi:hypothetical protein